MNKDQLKKVLQAYKLKPNHASGQHFFSDQGVLEKMVTAGVLVSTDAVLEIGPGLGVLTEALLSRVGRVVAVELDRELIKVLRANFVNRQLELHQANILSIGFETLRMSQPYKIVANLPYSVTSAFFKKFLAETPRPETIVVLIQKEVAMRICAAPGQMSLLTLSVQLYGTPEIIATVKPESFYPKPAVDSAILKISQIASDAEVSRQLTGVSEHHFWQLARIGYSAKRKKLYNNLAAGLRLSSVDVQKALVATKIDVDCRAQNLTIADWVRLAKQLTL